MRTTTWIYIGTLITSMTASAAYADDPAGAQLSSWVQNVPEPDREVLSGRSIQKVVRARRGSVALCYERSLKRDKKLRGRVAILVTLRPSGHVSHTRVATKTFAGTPVAECIRNTIAKWRFPSFSGELSQQVLLPFSLRRT